MTSLVLLFALYQAAGAAPQASSATKQQPQATATVSGIVVNDAATMPLRKASVRLLPDFNQQGTVIVGGVVGGVGIQPGPAGGGPQGTTQLSVISDAEGRFSFANLQPGNYRLLADRPGFVFKQGSGNRFTRGRGMVLSIGDGQKLSVVLHLAPGAVVRGRVLDEDGDPVTGANVQTMQETYVRGRKVLRPSGSAQTDDRGEYRAYGLTPGRYYVVANYRGGFARRFGPGGAGNNVPETSYVPTFYPGASDRDQASRIELHAGDEVSADFTLLRAATVPVRGMVVVGGRPANRGNVTLQYNTGMMQPADNAEVRDGRFELHVAPGRYMLTAQAFSESNAEGIYTRSGPAANTRQRVEVGANGVDGLNVVVGEGTHITGRVRAEGDPNFDAQRVSLSLRSLDDDSDVFGGGSNTSAQVKKDGTFEIRTVAPGDYLPVASVRSASGNDWYVKAVLLGTHDVLDSGLRIGADMANLQLDAVLSGDAASLEGTVTSGNLPASNATVVLVPAPERRRRSELFRTTTTDQNGHFTIRAVQPGDYTMLALDDVEDGAWFDPEFQQQFADRGDRISVRPTEKQQVAAHLVQLSAQGPGQ